MRCWGRNDFGQSSPAPRLKNVLSVATGARHTCAILKNSQLACWGGAGYGQLKAPSLSARKLWASRWGNVAQSRKGKFVCWGTFKDGYPTSSPCDKLKGHDHRITDLTFPDQHGQEVHFFSSSERRIYSYGRVPYNSAPPERQQMLTTGWLQPLGLLWDPEAVALFKEAIPVPRKSDALLLPGWLLHPMTWHCGLP